MPRHSGPYLLISWLGLSACTGNIQAHPDGPQAGTRQAGDPNGSPGAPSMSITTGGGLAAPVGGIPDLTVAGPLAVAAPTEYKFPLTLDANVVTDANTELW